MRIGLMGRSGFVGRAMNAEWQPSGHQVIGLSRIPLELADRPAPIGDSVPPNSAVEAFRRQLSGLDLLVNCAGVTVVRTGDESRSARLANEHLPALLYEEAAIAGVPCFVHISSVASIASCTPQGLALNDHDDCVPDTPYGESKLAGDKRLMSVSRTTPSMVILRPPILYGSEARGIFKILRGAAQRGIPLPIGDLKNQRNFMFVGNLPSAVLAAAAQQLSGAYIVTDHPPMRPGEFYDLMTCSAGKGRRSINVPAPLASALASIVLRERAHSLLRDSTYDDSRFRRQSNWAPPYSLSTAIQQTMWPKLI